MEFLRTIRRRSFLSESVYISLNVALAVAILVIVQTVASPIPALLLVLLSKWRVFAVRPRYWAANIQANLVDVIVSISTVVLMYSVGTLPGGLLIQIGISILYILWLVILKPKSSRRMIVAQAGVALAAGTMALFVVSYGWAVEYVVITMGLIGYVTARHVLTQYEEDHLQFLSTMWAFVMASLAWVLSHWVIAYTVAFIDVRIPQAVFIVVAFAFVSYQVYASYRRHGQVRSSDVILPILFSASIVAIVLLFFSGIPVGAL